MCGCVCLVLWNFITCELYHHHHSQDKEEFHHSKDPECYPFTAIPLTFSLPHLSFLETIIYSPLQLQHFMTIIYYKWNPMVYNHLQLDFFHSLILYSYQQCMTQFSCIFISIWYYHYPLIFTIFHRFIVISHYSEIFYFKIVLRYFKIVYFTIFY